MKVLKIIHGFPPDYMAGSEVYSYHLSKELVNQGIEVSVFTRVENEFDDLYKIYDEEVDGIKVRRINRPKRDYLIEDKYYDLQIEELYAQYLNEVKPDIVHIGHLSHLSTRLISITKEHNIPVVFTIHDFWMFCVKGQLINAFGQICDGPSAKSCSRCSPYITSEDVNSEFLNHMQHELDLVDHFISPSMTLKDFYVKQGIPSKKIDYLKYGFDTHKISYQRRQYNESSSITFGFMGRIVPTKGIQVLIEAFKQMPEVQLNIYGGIGAQKRFLEQANIQFTGAYNNNDIADVLADFDVIIVPSTWLENAPLVIQEAFLAGKPVITSDIGGMKELVENGIDGFTFKAGSCDDLISTVRKIVQNPKILNSLKDARHKVVSIEDDAKAITGIYRRLLK